MPALTKQEPAKKASARLSTDELCKIAEQLVNATEPQEVERLKQEFMRGWYGDEVPHA